VVAHPAGAQVRLHEEYIEDGSNTGRMAGTPGTGTEVGAMNRMPDTNVGGTSPTRTRRPPGVALRKAGTRTPWFRIDARAMADLSAQTRKTK
jgi:hypothetical protein